MRIPKTIRTILDQKEVLININDRKEYSIPLLAEMFTLPYPTLYRWLSPVAVRLRRDKMIKGKAFKEFIESQAKNYENT